MRLIALVFIAALCQLPNNALAGQPEEPSCPVAVVEVDATSQWSASSSQVDAARQLLQSGDESLRFVSTSQLEGMLRFADSSAAPDEVGRAVQSAADASAFVMVLLPDGQALLISPAHSVARISFDKWISELREQMAASPACQSPARSTASTDVGSGEADAPTHATPTPPASRPTPTQPSSATESGRQQIDPSSAAPAARPTSTVEPRAQQTVSQSVTPNHTLMDDGFYIAAAPYTEGLWLEAFVDDLNDFQVAYGLFAEAGYQWAAGDSDGHRLLGQLRAGGGPGNDRRWSSTFTWRVAAGYRYVIPFEVYDIGFEYHVGPNLAFQHYIYGRDVYGVEVESAQAMGLDLSVTNRLDYQNFFADVDLSLGGLLIYGALIIGYEHHF